MWDARPNISHYNITSNVSHANLDGEWGLFNVTNQLKNSLIRKEKNFSMLIKIVIFVHVLHFFKAELKPRGLNGQYLGLQWCYCGQHHYLQLKQPEFESFWLFIFCTVLSKDENK